MHASTLNDVAPIDFPFCRARSLARKMTFGKIAGAQCRKVETGVEPIKAEFPMTRHNVVCCHFTVRQGTPYSCPLQWAYFCRQCDNIHCFAANRHILGRHAYATAEAAQSICDYIIEMWNGDALLTSMATVGLCCTNHRQRHISADGTAGAVSLEGIPRCLDWPEELVARRCGYCPDSGFDRNR